MKTAIITGANGQLSSYFIEFLLKKYFKVIGTLRRVSNSNHINISHIENENLILEPMDLGDVQSINNVIEKYKPDYFINGAANTLVTSSQDFPEQHFEYNSIAVLRQLEAIRKYSPKTRYINFGSSTEFVDTDSKPYDENTPLGATNLYAASKIAARQIVKVYREKYNLYATQPWCGNYESPRRGNEFLSRKISLGVARIYKAIRDNKDFEPIFLGNLYPKKDWSHALDVVEAAWRILNQERYLDETFRKRIPGAGLFFNEVFKPKDYVISAGNCYSVRDLIENAFSCIDIKGRWINEIYYNSTEKVLVEKDPKFYRKGENSYSIGNPQKIKYDLGWEPKFQFEDIINDMVKSDIQNY